MISSPLDRDHSCHQSHTEMLTVGRVYHRDRVSSIAQMFLQVIRTFTYDLSSSTILQYPDNQFGIRTTCLNIFLQWSLASPVSRWSVTLSQRHWLTWPSRVCRAINSIVQIICTRRWTVIKRYASGLTIVPKCSIHSTGGELHWPSI